MRITLTDITLVAPPFESGTGVALPCPGMPRIDTIAPLRTADDVRSPAALHEDAAEELIERRTVELIFESLNAAERAQILAAWAHGRGCVRPFRFAVPGDAGSTRRWVFRDPELNLERSSAARGDVIIRLLEVPRPDLDE